MPTKQNKKSSSSGMKVVVMVVIIIIFAVVVGVSVYFSRKKQPSLSTTTMPPTETKSSSGDAVVSSSSADSTTSTTPTTMFPSTTIEPTTTIVPSTTIAPTTTIVPTTTLAPSAPLDALSESALSGMLFAYSVKRLLTSYTGPVLNIRRSSDNTTLDFYADVYGNLGTELNGGGTRLSTWLNGSKGYVATWYDQSGKGNHASMTSTTSQPSIDETNKYINFRDNANAYLTQPDSSYSAGNYPYTIVWKQYTTSDNGFIHWQGIMGNNTALYTNTQNSNSTYRHAWWQLFYWDLAINATNNTMVYTYNGNGTVACYKNGASQGTASTGARYTQTGYATLGALRTSTATSSYINGELYFIMSFNTVLSDIDRGITEQLSGY